VNVRLWPKADIETESKRAFFNGCFRGEKRTSYLGEERRLIQLPDGFLNCVAGEFNVARRSLLQNLFVVALTIALRHCGGGGGGCGRPLTVEMQRMYTISFEED
jgi:hypothetical protein